MVIYNEKRVYSSREVNIVNICAPNTTTPKYIKQIQRELKGEINSNIIIVWDYNIPLSTMGRILRHKNKKHWT